MIKFVNDTINEVITYLQHNYPRNEIVYIHIAEGYDSVTDSDGNMGFGVYVPEVKSIFIAGDVPEPETTIIETIAHEYKHFMQHCDGEPFDEEAAEAFAMYVVHKLQNQDESEEPWKEAFLRTFLSRGQ